MPPKISPAYALNQLRTTVTRLKILEEYAMQITEDDKPSQAEVTTRISTLKGLYGEYEKILEKTCSFDQTEEEDGKAIELLVQEVEALYHNALSKLSAFLVPTPVFPNNENSVDAESHRIQNIKLPEVNIPVSDGKPTEWLAFKETFTAVIHNNQKISEVIKFTYLLDKVKGDAKQTIGHITLSEIGYSKAWNDLMERYDNKRQIIEIHVDGLSNLASVNKDNSAELRKLLNQCNSHISSLESLGQKLEGLSQMFVINSITKKIDSSLKKDWESELKPDELPTWVQLQSFLSKKCRILEAVEFSKKSGTKATNPTGNKLSNAKSSQSSFVTSNKVDASKPNITTSYSGSCKICKMTFHPFYLCKEFTKLSVEERFNKIKELNLCFNCFSSKHNSRECTKGPCKHCSKKHNSLIHRGEVLIRTDLETNNEINSNGTALMTKQLVHTKTLFPTAMILIQDKLGKFHRCRALLDSASDANFISKDLVHALSFESRIGRKATVTSLNDQKTILYEIINATISSPRSKFKKNLNFSVVPTIVNSLPETNVNISRWSLPPALELADPNFNMSQKVDLLIGNEVFFEIIKPKQIQLSPNLPILQQSVFGWLIVGPYQTNTCANFANVCGSETENEKLNKTITKFWEMESLPEKSFLSESEKLCEDHYEKNHYRDSSGRYFVSLLLTDEVKNLGESKTQALKRFSSLERKLHADQELKQQYSQFINEYIALNHMKKVTESHDSDNQNFYLPHHGVLKPSSSTTKLRVVFDASAKSNSNISLNDVMLIGPTVQPTLFNIMLRFRKHPVVMTADISKMYRQINIVPNQTKFQRIFWRFNQTDPIETYELQTVTYGTAAAPYLATRTLNQLSKDESNKFPDVSRIVREDFYVDDVLTGAPSIVEGLKIQSELIQMLSLGGFELHKWCSNSDELLANIPAKDKEVLRKDEFSSHESIKTLGLSWKPKQDLFYFNVDLMNEITTPTKRLILSNIARLYDPLGLLSPITITAKIIMQSIWKSHCDWDEIVSPEIAAMWHEFRNQLPNINEVNFKRCIIPNDPISIEMHGFSDSSERAFGACIFLRCVDNKKNVHVSLVCSKTKVAPLKIVSLPRLELCAALLLSRLISNVIKSLDLKYDQVVLWSDSTITLQWINMAPHKLKTFVANRVNEIQELTNDYEWRHVPSKDNAADVISRGILPDELKNLDSWWNGPAFLSIKSNEFKFDEEESTTTTVLNNDPKILELKSDANCALVTKSIDFDLFFRYSSFEKLIRVTALCIRFYKNLKNKPGKQVNELSVSEINNALLALVKNVQKSEFKSEIDHLNSNKPVPRNSKIRDLNPFLDEQQLLRVGGRLSRSDYDYDTKHQLLLPYHHPFTELMFRHEHLKNFHAGPQLLMSLVRLRFWPVKAKILAKQIVRKCVICFKAKPKLSSQLMGDLPNERTKPNNPFATTGIDLCGPFLIKNKYPRKGPVFRVYVATFICFVSKAVHLEIVSDLSSESFLACLKRFLYRRGNCSTICSDNATNFVGCNNELKRQRLFLTEKNLERNIIDYCALRQITWKFIPPNAPNFGGLWESSVKSLKYHLKRVTKNQILTYEELNTFIIQIEGIMNSRPISNMSSDPSDPEPLTPAHFLTGGSIVAPPETLYDQIPPTRLTNWKRLEQLVQSFWKRFSIEYIHTLQQRNKWKDSVPNLKENDIVLISNESSQPTHWLLGRIIKIIPGNDGKCRVFDIKTQNGMFRRPISKLCKLPIDD